MRTTTDPKPLSLGFRVNRQDRKKLLAHLAQTNRTITALFREVIQTLPDPPEAKQILPIDGESSCP